MWVSIRLSITPLLTFLTPFKTSHRLIRCQPQRLALDAMDPNLLCHLRHDRRSLLRRNLSSSNQAQTGQEDGPQSRTLAASIRSPQGLCRRGCCATDSNAFLRAHHWVHLFVRFGRVWNAL